MNRCKKRDVSRDPYFIQLRHHTKRQRDFHPLRRHLMNAFFQLCLSRHDLVTGIIELNLDSIAKELSKQEVIDTTSGEVSYLKSEVTVSRISRLINEVMIPFGLAYVYAGTRGDTKSGMVWDRTHRCWFPKVLVLTDEFYRISGADIEKLNIQREQQLEFRNSGIADPNEILSVAEARKRKRIEIFSRAWNKRKDNSVRGRREKKLAAMPLDERKHYIAKEIKKELSTIELDMLSTSEFNRMVWKRLNQAGLGFQTLPSIKPTE